MKNETKQKKNISKVRCLMANTYPVAQESYSKMELQLKICSNHYKKADYEKLIEYADNLTVMIHAYLSS